MLRFEYKDTTNTRIRQCKECIDYHSCPKYTRKFNPEFGECIHGRFINKRPEVNGYNAIWLLLQIKRELIFSRSVTESLLQSYRLDSKIFNETTPSIGECQIFIELMKTFQLFIRERCIEYDKLKTNRKNSYVAFVNSILDTKIKVEGDEVMVFSKNEPLVETLKDITLKEKYMFRTIITEQEANSWWGPITKENYVTY